MHMPKPRPKQAAAPEQQRPTRDDRASTKGASAPLVVPRGENTVKQAQHPTPNSTKPPVNADPIGATTPDSGPGPCCTDQRADAVVLPSPAFRRRGRTPGVPAPA